MCFFFQAEDGIRDLVRSRGLGDVYKRQGPAQRRFAVGAEVVRLEELDQDQRYKGHRHRLLLAAPGIERPQKEAEVNPVSYTHLTLPTSDLV